MKQHKIRKKSIHNSQRTKVSMRYRRFHQTQLNMKSWSHKTQDCWLSLKKQEHLRKEHTTLHRPCANSVTKFRKAKLWCTTSAGKTIMMIKLHKLTFLTKQALTQKNNQVYNRWTSASKKVLCKVLIITIKEQTLKQCKSLKSLLENK